MNALILVDLQNDFFPGGSLAVNKANEILPAINKLLTKDFDMVIASKDWHPGNHGSFAATHGKHPGEHINLSGMDQILWPTHCVQNTKGAEFAPGWDTSKITKEFHKGTDENIDSYSTFFDNGHKKATGLEHYLKEHQVKDIYLAGLATDFCVKYSVLDALKLGFNIYVIEDACRGVNLNPHDEEKALAEMQQAGAHIITSEDVKFAS